MEWGVMGPIPLFFSSCNYYPLRKWWFPTNNADILNTQILERPIFFPELLPFMGERVWSGQNCLNSLLLKPHAFHVDSLRLQWCWNPLWKVKYLVLIWQSIIWEVFITAWHCLLCLSTAKLPEFSIKIDWSLSLSLAPHRLLSGCFLLTGIKRIQ